VANENKDVELRIRARDYSQKTFKQLTSVYQALIKVQESQAEASEKGEASARDLEATYKRLEDAGRALLSLNALTKMYSKQAEALQLATGKAAEARQRQQQLTAEYNKTETATKKQTTQLAAATRASEAANRAEEKRRASLASTTAQLERYGVDVSNIAGAQQGFAAGVNSVNAALERQEKTLAELGVNKAAAQARKSAADEVAATEKVVDALKRQADQAIATAKGYRTLGRVVNTTTGNYGELGLQIRSIISPADVARNTLNGLEKQITDTAANTDKLSKSTNTAKDAMRQLGEAQRRLIGLSGLIDQFRNQNAQLRVSRGEYNAARADLQQLSAQLRTSGADYQQLGAKIQQAQLRLNTAAQTLRSQTEAARKTQTALRDAGVETNKLAQSQDRLVASANQSVSAVERLSRAVRTNSRDNKDASKWTNYFTNSNRESLSMFQRVRGELIALATAYVGLQGVINLAGGAVDAYKMREKALIRAETYVPGQSAAEWEYIVNLADALSIRLDTLADSYTKFAVSATQTGLSLQEARYIYESVGKAGRVMKLSDDDMKGVFRALEQMLSKGQVYAEELRQQLGERLPGAVSIFAKGMEVPMDKFMKMMEQGGVTAKEVLNFATELNGTTAGQLDAATNSVAASEAKLATAQDKFRLAIADAGFIDAYTDLIVKLTEFLEGEKGTALAEKLAQVFSAVADAIMWAADNTDLLVSIFTTLAAIKIATWIGGFIVGIARAGKDIFKLVKGMGDTAKGLAGVTTASSKAKGALGLLFGSFRVLLRAVPVLGALLLAWDIGKILYDQSATARAAIDAVGDSFKRLPITIKAVMDSIPALFDDLTKGPLGKFDQLFRSNLKMVSGTWEALAREIPGVGDSLGDAIRDTFTIAEGQNRDFFQETTRVWDEAGKKWEEQQKSMVKSDKNKYDAMVKQAKDFSKEISKVTGVGLPELPAAAATGTPYQGPVRPADTRFTADPGTAPTPRERQIRELTKAFEKLQTKADKANKSVRENLARRDLPGRLALVDEEFAPMLTQAKGVGGKEGAELVAQLEKIIALRKETERLEFEGLDSDKRLKQLERLRSEYDKLSAEIGVQESKIDPTKNFEDRLKANLEKMEAQYTKIQSLASQVGGKEGAAFGAQFEALRKLNAELVTEQTRLTEIKYMEDQLTAQLDIKKYKIQELNAERQAGNMSEEVYLTKLKALDEERNPLIQASIDKFRAFVDLIKNSLAPEELARINAELSAMDAGLQQARYSTADLAAAQGILDGISGSLESVVSELTKAVVNVQSFGDAFRNIGAAVAGFFADLLMKIAQAIIQQTILNAIAGAGWGGVSSAAASMIQAGASHNGGTVGDKSSGSGFQNRGSVPASWFAGARRFHSGGLPGLKPDEVPTILQKGEQVLSKNDPDNVLNQVAKGGSGNGGMSARFVLVDDRAKVPEAMNSPEGEQVFTEFLTRNSLTVKQILGV
jgi:tape measure domain-containing protein